MTQTYLLLLLAVICETFGTSCLQASRQFTQPLPSIGVFVGFGAAFWILGHVLKTLPLGITYALWSGIGIVLIAVSGWAIFGQKLDAAAMLGLSLIIAGILIINLFSASAHH